MSPLGVAQWKIEIAYSRGAVPSLVPRLMSVGRTNPLRAGNFTSEGSSTENVECTPPHIIHNWILQHVNKAWTLSKLGQVTFGRS